MDLQVYIEGLSAYSDDLKWQQVNGVLTTTDNVSNEMIEKLVEANQKQNKLKIRWKHVTGNFAHHFTGSINNCQKMTKI